MNKSIRIGAVSLIVLSLVGLYFYKNISLKQVTVKPIQAQNQIGIKDSSVKIDSGVKKEQKDNSELMDQTNKQVPSKLQASSSESNGTQVEKSDSKEQQNSQVKLVKPQTKTTAKKVVDAPTPKVDNNVDAQSPKVNQSLNEQTQPKESQTQEIDDKSISKSLPVVMDFGSTCAPCRYMQEVLGEISKEYEGKVVIKIVSVYEQPDETQKYGIKLIPTQIFFDESGKEYFRHEGTYSKEEVISKLEEMGIK